MTNGDIVVLVLGIAWIALGAVTLARPQKFLSSTPRRQIPLEIRMRRYRWLGVVYLVLGGWAIPLAFR
jgi:hypothetical protein